LKNVEEDLENVKELVEEFKGRIEVEVRRQKEVGIKNLERVWKVKLNLETKEFRRIKLLGKYIVKILFRWDNGKFEEEYLKKLERNWIRWKKEKVD